LKKIQPASGGFLEAVPLTSFVTLSLAACGLADHQVARNGMRFLIDSVRPDGSWPIDTNLATWVTTLALNALAAAGELERLESKDKLRDWLIRQQYTTIHPYTGAAPGGWAWTPLSGGVPDADDTAGALLALASLESVNATVVNFGLNWLVDLQNSDGGWPTFCRGWGHLPFDRSGCDLTAHVLRGMRKWTGRSLGEFNSSKERGLAYLAQTQRADGSWLPLWFGNQHAPDDENPTYGTARVLAAYRDLDKMNDEPARRGVAWLLAAQNGDGGWGGAAATPSSMEETALAVEVLLDVSEPSSSAQGAVNKGLAWLVEHVSSGGLEQPTAIGFYFAKLWYFEKLYPIIFTVAALGKARRKLTPVERH
jgi:squalene-hopene/tetraprenyl-beta-curcumene cyclase